MDILKKILVVDDEPDIKAVIRLRLEKAGCQVLMAANGQEAMDLMKGEPPDLIISDTAMPVMDGASFYQELKESRASSSIPVLMLFSSNREKQEFPLKPSDDFILKPLDHRELLSKVAHLLRLDTPRMDVFMTKKILVAGSDDEVVGEMAGLLKSKEHLVNVSTQGPDVISKAVLFSPDLIILEVQMFQMPSEEIIRILRLMPNFGKTPILVYSYYRLSDLGREDVRQKALSVDSSQKHCLENGATEYIGRYQEPAFLKAVEKYLDSVY